MMVEGDETAGDSGRPASRGTRSNTMRTSGRGHRRVLSNSGRGARVCSGSRIVSDRTGQPDQRFAARPAAD